MRSAPVCTGRLLAVAVALPLHGVRSAKAALEVDCPSGKASLKVLEVLQRYAKAALLAAVTKTRQLWLW